MIVHLVFPAPLATNPHQPRLSLWIVNLPCDAQLLPPRLLFHILTKDRPCSKLWVVILMGRCLDVGMKVIISLTCGCWFRIFWLFSLTIRAWSKDEHQHVECGSCLGQAVSRTWVHLLKSMLREALNFITWYFFLSSLMKIFLAKTDCKEHTDNPRQKNHFRALTNFSTPGRNSHCKLLLLCCSHSWRILNGSEIVTVWNKRVL